MAVALIIVYILGWLSFFYALIPGIVQGPTGAWLYRACVLQPRSWALGIPFVIGAFVIATAWPLVLVLWLVTGRRPPPLITTQALLDHYGVPYDGEGPVLARVPRDIRKRLGGHQTRLRTEFDSSSEFWKLYLARN